MRRTSPCAYRRASELRSHCVRLAARGYLYRPSPKHARHRAIQRTGRTEIHRPFLSDARGAIFLRPAATTTLAVSFAVNAKAKVKDFTSGLSVVIDIEGPAASAKVAETKNEAPPPVAQAPTPITPPLQHRQSRRAANQRPVVQSPASAPVPISTAAAAPTSTAPLGTQTPVATAPAQIAACSPLTQFLIA